KTPEPTRLRVSVSPPRRVVVRSRFLFLFWADLSSSRADHNQSQVQQRGRSGLATQLFGMSSCGRNRVLAGNLRGSAPVGQSDQRRSPGEADAAVARDER